MGAVAIDAPSSGDSKDSAVKLQMTGAPLAAPAPGPAPAPVLVQVNMALTPAEAFWKLVEAGTLKAQAPWFKLAIGGLLAGFYVSFGFSFCCASVGLLGNTIYGALSFPFALTLILFCGGELFTGNTCYMFSANIERKAAMYHHIRICMMAWGFNFCGNLIMVNLLYEANSWKGREDWIHVFAHKKMSNTWKAVFVRGIFANWLVNLAVWQAVCARDITGKTIGIWPPIVAFVAIGFEHCIANQFIIPMSMKLPTTAAYPEAITWRNFVANNLVPATMGNWIGGAVMVGLLNAAYHGTSIPKWKDQAYDATIAKVLKPIEPAVEAVVDFAAPVCLNRPAPGHDHKQ